MDRVEEFILSGSRRGSYSQSAPEISPFGFFDIHIEEGPTEIPDFATRIIGSYAQSEYNLISYILYGCPSTTTRRLVRGALSDFMRADRYSAGIPQVTMSNGRTYYGLPGAIFDSNFNLLMLMTSIVVIKEERGSRPYPEILSHICRVSPLVFMNQDSIIEKTIIKKVIPFCAAHVGNETDYSIRTQCNAILGKTIKVIIEDINPLFIRRIVAPNPDVNISENIQGLLRHNVKGVISDN